MEKSPDEQPKPVSDQTLSRDQFISRKARHPKIEQAEFNFKVGDNVFLKRDLSKLRGREMYKIIHIYTQEPNQEQMATVRKCENKFMSKNYEVKLAELKLATSNSISASDDTAP